MGAVAHCYSEPSPSTLRSRGRQKLQAKPCRCERGRRARGRFMNAVCSPGKRDAQHPQRAERKNKLGENTASQSHPAASTAEILLRSIKGLPFPSPTCKVWGKKGESRSVQKMKRTTAFTTEEQGPEMLWGAGWEQGSPGALKGVGRQ